MVAALREAAFRAATVGSGPVEYETVFMKPSAKLALREKVFTMADKA